MLITNKTIARTLRLLGQLMELHDENPFKVRTINNAAFKIDKLPFALADKTLEEIDQIEGVGKSTASKVWELIHNNFIKDLQDLLEQTPEGIVEMLQVKGIGPKKIETLWKDMGIENIGELYYACNENRLIEAKGFGIKTQEEIKKVIEFRMASSGRFLYSQVEKFAENLLKKLQQIFKTDLISLTGTYRRRYEIIDELEVLTGISLSDELLGDIKLSGLIITEQQTTSLIIENELGIKSEIRFCDAKNFGWELILQTGSDEHISQLKKLIGEKAIEGKTEAEIYEAAGLSFIEPELREGTNEFELAMKGQLPQLITYPDLKGTLHNHSPWSDGVNTLEEMAVFCKEDLKLSYLGICDHSKSAFYAKGLDENRVAAQQREIDELNIKLSPFHIFKGIESDILYDGSLDYSTDVLETFDFVVASIHSTLKMSEEKATERLIKAVENPYTTILGHPTGRLLLSRSGYPIDHKRVIDACAANQVVIEINANPLRLDLDWRWHQYAIEKGIVLSINPDAHRKDGFYDMHYGVLVARKGGVSTAHCLNAMSLDEIKLFFKNKNTTH
ncbi:MAG: helix-hairpin-helix domain-containing protein [Daejeonella sp.]